MTVLTWTPHTGSTASPLVFETGQAAELRLIKFAGVDPPTVDPYTSKGPSQEGETALDVIIPSRIVNAQAMIQGATAAALETVRHDIAKSFAATPVRFGESLLLGRLTIERVGFPDREIDALPRSAVTARAKAPGIGSVDVEWLCPYPYWRDTADSAIASIAVAGSSVAANAGDVDAPIIAQLWGPATSVTLTNTTTGEAFTIVPSSALLSTDYLEIDTARGVKSITRVASGSGARANAMAGLSLTTARLWLLRPGNNTVAFAAAGSTGATHAALLWRNRYAGL